MCINSMYNSQGLPEFKKGTRAVPFESQSTAAEKFHPNPHRGGKNMHSSSQRAIKDHFQEHFSSYNLSDLDVDLTEEIKTMVMHAPTEKAPRLDDFIDAFYRACWETINHNVVAALREMFVLRGGCWNLLNSTNITLIPKKQEATTVIDFRPISVMHSIAKIMGSVLAWRLAPYLDRIVWKGQSAFIKGRRLHDNF
jgi:hypothetical protein